MSENERHEALPSFIEKALNLIGVKRITGQVIEKLLKLLPQDVLEDAEKGELDASDPAFKDGLSDHISRIAQKRKGKLEKILRFMTPESEPIRNKEEKVGRNDKCPCGSGRKFKQCCMHEKK